MLASSTHNENDLVRMVSEGNEKAFRQLYDSYWDHIYSVAFALCKSSALSEEIVQDVFIKIWLKRDKLVFVSNFKGYLFIVSRNHIYNVLRKKIAEQPFTDRLEQHFMETSGLPEQQMMLKETKQLIDKAVQQLPAQQRAVFELSRGEGLEHRKIAEKLGISKLTVKSHMTKALQTIRQYLQRHTAVIFTTFLISIIIFALLF